MPEDTTRRGFLAAAGSGAAAALAGCSSNPPSETSTATATPDEGTPEPTATATDTPDEKPKGGTLRLASAGPVQTLDPVSAKGSGAGYNQYNASLMNFPNGDLPPVADLAKDYTVSNDGKTYTFELKQGVKFHNGDELTAQDFVYSWERLAGAAETKNADDIVGDTF
ncbi:MAG: ABC transporter substrate-binding protein, partial [Halobaculum sp.]